VPHPRRRTVAEQVHIQLIEAAVETGFGLIDDARDFRASGESELSSRALEEAGKTAADLEDHLRRLGDSKSWPFLLLVAELRTEIAEAERGVSYRVEWFNSGKF
jgi:hypothetical protein